MDTSRLQPEAADDPTPSPTPPVQPEDVSGEPRADKPGPRVVDSKPREPKPADDPTPGATTPAQPQEEAKKVPEAPEAEPRVLEPNENGWRIVGFQAEPFYGRGGSLVVTFGDAPKPLRVRLRVHGTYRGLPTLVLWKDFTFHNKEGRRLPVYSILPARPPLDKIVGHADQYVEFSIFLCKTETRFLGMDSRGFPRHERAPGAGFPPEDVLVAWRGGAKTPLLALAPKEHAPAAVSKEYALKRAIADALTGTHSQKPDSKPAAKGKPQPPARPAGLIRTLGGHKKNVFRVAFSPDGALLASSAMDGTARLWDPKSGKAVCTIQVEPYATHVTGLGFSPDGRSLATGSKHLKLWDPATGAEKWSVSAHAHKGRASRVQTLAFSPDGRTLATGSLQGAGVKLWNAADGTMRRALKGFEDGVSHLVFSPDGARLAGVSSSDRAVLIWDPKSGDLARTIELESRLTAVAYWPAPRMLVVSSYGRSVFLCDRETGEVRRKLSTERSSVGKLVLTADGRHVLTAKGGLAIWNARTGERVATVHTDKSLTHGLALSPDGTILATGGDDTLVKLWKLSELIE